MDRYIFMDILGDTVAQGIESFYTLKSSLSDDTDLDYASLLIESLGSEILDRKEFVNFFLLQGLSDSHIQGISDKLKIDSSLSEFKKRKALLAASNAKIKDTIIELLELDQDYFKVEKAAKLITRESICPFTPVPIEEENCRDLIPMEYLSVHEYQKRIKDKLTKEIVFNPEAKALVHMPTGSGKTKTSVESIIDFIKIKFTYPHDPGTVLWFAHSKELCEQAYNTFKSLWSFKGDYPITAYKVFGDAEYKEILKCTKDHASIIFIGFQKFESLLKSKSDNLELHSIKQHLVEKTKLVVIDEAHKAL
ncbi:MAG: DEAD/DEAH box helicase family protein, partial [Flavobacteriaceae bacterium]|nr:DEAD/DEAH box helicase family protein [Flavobacteriaceae bacterium]